jgi:two-component system, LytTR family, response regulator
MKAIIVDDERGNAENLAALLKKYCPHVSVEALAMNAEEGKVLIIELRPDLVFLDIQMPLQNGFDLLKSLVNYSFEVIFVTAYDKYGIQAIRFSAIDYLLKPIEKEDLIAAVNRATEKILQKSRNLQL